MSNINESINMSLELRMAAKNGNLDLVSSAIKEGADIDGTGVGNNHTPLTLASAGGHIEVVKILIKNNADINKTDNCGYGYTPLHQACKKGHFEIAKLLIENKANINATDSHGQTPLHLVCKKRHSDIAKLLIKNKANLNIADKFQILPLLIAFDHGQTEITDLLQKKGAKLFPSDDNEGIWSDLARKCNTESVKLIIDTVLLKNLEEKKPDIIQHHEELSAYWNECKTKLDFEILSLKKVTFGRVSLFNFYSLENINKLTVMSCNEKIQDVITKADFIVKYPHFGKKIKKNFEKGLARNELTEGIIENLYSKEQQQNWIASFFIEKKEEKKNIRLVGVEDVDREILSYLDFSSLKSLKEASNPLISQSSMRINLFKKFTMQKDSRPENTPVTSYLHKLE